MLYKYSELIKNKIYKNDKEIKEALNNKKLYRIEFGLYSKSINNSKLEIITKKYEKYIFTSQSAYFYQGLTDYIPDKYYLAGNKGSQKIKNCEVVQTFMDKKYLEMGVETINYNNVLIKVFNKEKMLIELVRNKNSLPYDYYKEIINNYRKIIDNLDLILIQKYLKSYKDSQKLLKIIQDEVL